MIKVLVFDVIGTLLDWKGSILEKLEKIATSDEANKLAADWAFFYAANDFKTEVDLIIRGAELLIRYDLIGQLSVKEKRAFCSLWTRLSPWTDVIPGMKELKKNYQLICLTNCHTEVIVSLSKNAKLEWNQIISTEFVGVKKPDPKTYQYVLKIMNVKPAEAMMVASHPFDLRAAQAEGFQTAYLQRGEDEKPLPTDKFDTTVNNLLELAAYLDTVKNAPLE